MAGTPSVTSMLVFATLALLVLYHGFDHVTDLVGHSKSIEAAAAACPVPPGPVQREMGQWQAMHLALVQELRTAQDAGVRHPTLRGFPATAYVAAVREELDRDAERSVSMTSEAAPDLQQGLDVVFYGDSITESWRGTEMNSTRSQRLEAIKRVYDEHFSKYRSIVLAISGACPSDKAGGLPE